MKATNSVYAFISLYNTLKHSANSLMQRLPLLQIELSPSLQRPPVSFKSKTAHSQHMEQVRFTLAWLYYSVGKVQWNNMCHASALKCLQASYALDAKMRHFPQYKAMDARKDSRPRPTECTRPSRQYTRVFQTNTKYLSQKWNHYLPLYDKVFAQYKKRNVPVSLLEIGVNNGGSLETWKKYFPKHSQVIGVDINPKCQNLEFSDGITFVLGDATDKAFVDEQFAHHQFDIIIDDGSHFSHDVIASFKLLFEKLKWGGLYIVEDTSPAYWSSLGGSMYAKESQIAFFQTLVHGINFIYVENDDCKDMPPEQFDYLAKMSSEIASITFYANVIVIEKYAEKRIYTFHEIVSQGQETVTNMLSEFDRYTKDSSVLRLYKR